MWNGLAMAHTTGFPASSHPHNRHGICMTVPHPKGPCRYITPVLTKCVEEWYFGLRWGFWALFYRSLGSRHLLVGKRGAHRP